MMVVGHVEDRSSARLGWGFVQRRQKGLLRHQDSRTAWPAQELMSREEDGILVGQ